MSKKVKEEVEESIPEYLNDNKEVCKRCGSKRVTLYDTRPAIIIMGIFLIMIGFSY